jgi:exopolyphosphatase/guanosine-5'-triphosphate,3'-diphosphate pyrophosphatase
LPSADRAPAGEHFVVIDAFSRVVRLGEGLAQTGRLSQEAMDRALGRLQICADKLKRRNVHLARSVATEACRRAVNGEEFIERVRAGNRHPARHHQRRKKRGWR